MTQSTLHYAIELIGISVRKLLITNEDDKQKYIISSESDLPAEIVQVCTYLFLMTKPLNTFKTFFVRFVEGA